ncbi:MAG: AAA family ATPase [Candidatus Peribacteraceae bacterium]|mgnify:CR=1|jgi:gluconate kinase|nr:AAA family ATPase [Candidatus Peribacteraceae bacterium]|tara:strand:+ start:17792 stop:18301 length:510 start_codon:yes stop_codon:yes gene_type:complete
MKVLLITGPGGSGKSTVAEMIASQNGFVYLDGDNEDTEFFPNGNQWLPENVELLRKAHDKILNKVRALIDKGNNVVIDYIIFGQYEGFIKSFRNEFGDNFSVKVLFPSFEKMAKRDAERKCWTTGKERIETVHSEFEALKDIIGEENYLDTSEQSPEDTVQDIISTLTK